MGRHPEPPCTLGSPPTVTGLFLPGPSLSEVTALGSEGEGNADRSQPHGSIPVSELHKPLEGSCSGNSARGPSLVETSAGSVRTCTHTVNSPASHLLHEKGALHRRTGDSWGKAETADSWCHPFCAPWEPAVTQDLPCPEDLAALGRQTGADPCCPFSRCHMKTHGSLGPRCLVKGKVA